MGDVGNLHYVVISFLVQRFCLAALVLAFGRFGFRAGFSVVCICQNLSVLFLHWLQHLQGVKYIFSFISCCVLSIEVVLGIQFRVWD